MTNNEDLRGVLIYLLALLIIIIYTKRWKQRPGSGLEMLIKFLFLYYIISVATKQLMLNVAQ